jgi:hypothetical protein
MAVPTRSRRRVLVLVAWEVRRPGWSVLWVGADRPHVTLTAALQQVLPGMVADELATSTDTVDLAAPSPVDDLVPQAERSGVRHGYESGAPLSNVLPIRRFGRHRAVPSRVAFAALPTLSTGNRNRLPPFLQAGPVDCRALVLAARRHLTPCHGAV